MSILTIAIQIELCYTNDSKGGNTMKTLIKINAWVLVLGAILTITNNPLGPFVFFYTCVIGLIDGIKQNNFNSILVNSALGAMNTYYIIVFLKELF